MEQESNAVQDIKLTIFIEVFVDNEYMTIQLIKKQINKSRQINHINYYTIYCKDQKYIPACYHIPRGLVDGATF